MLVGRIFYKTYKINNNKLIQIIIFPVPKEVFNLNLILISFFFVVCGVVNAASENIAKGTITVDRRVININYSVARPLFDDIIILLSDNPVPKEMVPDGILGLSEKEKFSGIMFSLSSKNKRLLGKGESIQSIHFHSVWDQLGTIGNGQLELISSDENTIRGKIFTPELNKWGEHTFSYDIEFEVDIKKEPVKVSIKADTDDAPSKAFSNYYSAVMAGNTDEFKKYIAKARIREMEAEPGMMELFVEMQQVMSPTNIEILSSLIDKDRAFLVIIGNRGEDVSKGKIDMILEDKKWKVNLETWETIN